MLTFSQIKEVSAFVFQHKNFMEFCKGETDCSYFKPSEEFTPNKSDKKAFEKALAQIGECEDLLFKLVKTDYHYLDIQTHESEAEECFIRQRKDFLICLGRFILANYIYLLYNVVNLTFMEIEAIEKMMKLIESASSNIGVYNRLEGRFIDAIDSLKTEKECDYSDWPNAGALLESYINFVHASEYQLSVFRAYIPSDWTKRLLEYFNEKKSSPEKVEGKLRPDSPNIGPRLSSRALALSDQVNNNLGKSPDQAALTLQSTGSEGKEENDQLGGSKVNPSVNHFLIDPIASSVQPVAVLSPKAEPQFISTDVSSKYSQGFLKKKREALLSIETAQSPKLKQRELPLVVITPSQIEETSAKNIGLNAVITPRDYFKSVNTSNQF